MRQGEDAGFDCRAAVDEAFAAVEQFVDIALGALERGIGRVFREAVAHFLAAILKVFLVEGEQAVLDADGNQPVGEKLHGGIFYALGIAVADGRFAPHGLQLAQGGCFLLQALQHAPVGVLLRDSGGDLLAEVARHGRPLFIAQTAVNLLAESRQRGNEQSGQRFGREQGDHRQPEALGAIRK